MHTISKDAIAVYKKFDGDMDGWARMATAKDKQVISDGLWWAITGLIQDLKLVKNGLASESFIDATNKRLGLLVDKHSTIKLLESLI